MSDENDARVYNYGVTTKDAMQKLPIKTAPIDGIYDSSVALANSVSVLLISCILFI